MADTFIRRKRSDKIDSDSARKHLGITSEQTQGAPRLAHLLNQAEVGMESVITALRFSGEEDAITFIKKYDSISKSDLKHLSIDEICAAAGIDTRRMLMVIVNALMEYCLARTKLVIAANAVNVLEKTIEMALTEEGTADRRLFFEYYAFLEAQEFAKRNADPRRIEDGPVQLPDEAPQTNFKCGNQALALRTGQ